MSDPTTDTISRGRKALAEMKDCGGGGAGVQYVKAWADTISRALDSAEAELARPTFQCSDCGSTGPFRDVVYPNTPNGPEEYDIECVECRSLHIEESPRCAFSRAVNRLDEEKGAALERAEKAEAEVEEWKSKATSYDYDRRDACAEVRRLTAERRADELAVKLDGAIVVRDDEATRERIARACFEFDRGETWSERTNSDEKTYTEEADAVLAALREVSRG